MGWGFRKSIKIAPGIRVNFSKSGVSTSIGGKGFTYNTRGRVTASVPGTGIRFTHNLKGARTARPVGSVVLASSQLGADFTAHLSKRELATQDFVQKVRSRVCAALVNYFFSHGVYVHDDDLSEALSLEDHQEFLESLSDEFEATASAIQLAADIGSISLAEKERAMRALYEIERQCAEHQGDCTELKEAGAALMSAVQSWPPPPSLVIPFLVALCGSYVTGTSNLGVGLVLTVLMLAYGWFSVRSYQGNQEEALAVIDEANQRFDSLLTAEVTPRPEPPSSKDFVAPRAAGLAAITVVATLVAVVGHFSQPADIGVGGADGNPPSTPVSTTRPAQAAQSGRTDDDLSWLVGKYPSDVVADRKFKEAFRNVSRAEWKEISERLVVTNAAGIQLKNGFLVGEGCMAHACDTDRAAFAINESTGKGDLVVMKTPSPDSTPVFRTYQWQKMPIVQTPLADWEQQGLADAGLTADARTSRPAQANTPSFAPSFNCLKARSDAEHLVCDDAELAADDVELAVLYAKAKAAVIDQAAFKKRTVEQWTYREQTCHDRACLVRWYEEQKVALAEIARTGSLEK